MCFVLSHSNGHQALPHCIVAIAARQKQEHWHPRGIINAVYKMEVNYSLGGEASERILWVLE